MNEYAEIIKMSGELNIIFVPDAKILNAVGPAHTLYVYMLIN